MARSVIPTLEQAHKTVSQLHNILAEMYRTRQSRQLAWIPQDLARLAILADSLSFHISEAKDPGSADYLDVMKDPE